MNIHQLVRLRRHAEERGLSLNHLCVLAVVEQQPQPPSTIARLLGITSAAVTGQIDALTARGQVECVPDAHDRRKKYVTLTASGHHTLTSAEQALAA